jgi:hypothetical protein
MKAVNLEHGNRNRRQTALAARREEEEANVKIIVSVAPVLSDQSL